MDRTRRKLKTDNSLSALGQELNDVNSDPLYEALPLPEDSREPRQVVAEGARHAQEMSCVDVNSDAFNMFVGLAILGNAVLIGFETDIPSGKHTYLLLEHFYCLLFAGEAFLRIRQLGTKYFRAGSNLFDMFLVLTGAGSLYIVPLLSKGGGSSMWVSMLRLLRLLRVLRILRLFRLFSELSLILRAFLKALSTVMWIGILKVVLDYVIAVFLTQVVGKNAHLWGEDQDKIITWFGCIGSSMRTLFIIMTLAEWDTIAWTLMSVYPAMIVFPLFIVYIITGSYTTMSLVTGIISQSLMVAQHQDDAHRTAQIEEQRNLVAERIAEFLHSIDPTHAGSLSREQFKEAFRNNPQLLQQLAAADIFMDLDQVNHLLDFLPVDDKTGLISVEAVVDAMHELNGQASAAAVFELKQMVKLVLQNQDGSLPTHHTGVQSKKASEPWQSSEVGQLLSELERRLEEKIDGKLRALEHRLLSALAQAGDGRRPP